MNSWNIEVKSGAARDDNGFGPYILDITKIFSEEGGNNNDFTVCRNDAVEKNINSCGCTNGQSEMLEDNQYFDRKMNKTDQPRHAGECYTTLIILLP